MKKTLIAVAVLMASVASAGEITKEQMIQMYQDNEAAYMTVTPGMTAEYRHLDKRGKKCTAHVKEVVVASDPDKYLVYTKEIALSKCMGVKKGEVTEILTWKKIDMIDLAYFEGINYTKMTADGNLVTLEAELSAGETKVKNIIYSDVTKSQFYGVTEMKFGNEFVIRLVKRTVTDINSLKLENLEVRDHTNY